MKKIGLFAAGVLFGTAGMKLLGSKDAKRAYAQTTAAALRAKDSVMTAVTAVREGADDVYAEAKAINAQRTEDFRAGSYKRAGGVVDPVPEDAPFFVKDYHDYYKTARGYHKRSLNSNEGWNVTSSLSFMNARILAYSSEIRSAVLMIHGEKAHSCYFSRDAFAKLTGGNKELYIIPGAVHTDLYDRTDIIPFDKMKEFFKKFLG